MMNSTPMQGTHLMVAGAAGAQAGRAVQAAAMSPAGPGPARSSNERGRLPGFQQDVLSACLLLAIAMQLQFGVAAAHALPGDLLMQRMCLAAAVAFAARVLWRLRGCAHRAPLE